MPTPPAGDLRPGPGRETAELALEAEKKRVAKRNEAAHAAARAKRLVREEAESAKRRAFDLR